MIDTPPIDPTIHRLPMLPPPGFKGAFYPWWLGFNQIQYLPEQLLEGRSHILLNYVYDNLTAGGDSISPQDREVYFGRYDKVENIRRGNQSYQPFPQDAIDSQTYGKLEMPVMGLVGEGGAELKQALPLIASDFTIKTIPGAGHFIA